MSLTPEQERLSKLIMRFASTDGMRIPELGLKTVEKLIRLGIINELADFFNLTPNSFYLTTTISLAKAERICFSIKHNKALPFNKFIYCLNIPFIREQASTILAANLLTPKTLKTITLEDLETIPGIGNEKSVYLFNWLNDGGREQIDYMLRSVENKGCGLKIIDRVRLNPHFNIRGKRIFINGRFKERSPKHVQMFIRAMSGRCVMRLTENTDIMIVGNVESTVSRPLIIEAKQLNVRVEYDDFILELEKQI